MFPPPPPAACRRRGETAIQRQIYDLRLGRWSARGLKWVSDYTLAVSFRTAGSFVSAAAAVDVDSRSGLSKPPLNGPSPSSGIGVSAADDTRRPGDALHGYIFQQGRRLSSVTEALGTRLACFPTDNYLLSVLLHCHRFLFLAIFIHCQWLPPKKMFACM